MNPSVTIASHVSVRAIPNLAMFHNLWLKKMSMESDKVDFVVKRNVYPPKFC